MSWSFQIHNGDLNIGGPGGFSTVSSTAKLVQDLKHWMLEPRGTDPFHPDYGSLIDGGTVNSSFDSPSLLGGLMRDEDLMYIEAEIRRILNSYRIMQAERISDDRMKYGGKNTFSQGEILLTINSVEAVPMGDTVVVFIKITTADGQALSFSQAVSS